jgi:uncharacterized protein (TIGR02145 family)
MFKSKNISNKLEANDDLQLFVSVKNKGFGFITFAEFKKELFYNNGILDTGREKVAILENSTVDIIIENVGKVPVSFYDLKKFYFEAPGILNNDVKLVVFNKSIGAGYINLSDIPKRNGYGLLYNWFAVDNVKGILPVGFRIPGQTDYDTIIGGDFTAFDLRAEAPIWDGTNSSSLNLYPAGIRNANGTFSFLASGCFNLSTNDTGDNSIVWGTVSTSTVGTANYDKNIGTSVRGVSSTEPSTELVKDYDGNFYSWIKIGSLYWLKQALRTTKYNDGSTIPSGLNPSSWAAATEGAFVFPNNDETVIV